MCLSLLDHFVDKAKVDESEQKAAEYSKKVRQYSFQQPLSTGQLNCESFFLPRDLRQAIDFPCPGQYLAVKVHDPYQHYKNQCRCSDV